jgi:hypothetical protein
MDCLKVNVSCRLMLHEYTHKHSPMEEKMETTMSFLYSKIVVHMYVET